MTERSFSCCYFRCFCVLLTSMKSVSNTREGGGQGRWGRTENVQLVRRKVNLWNLQFVKNLLSPWKQNIQSLNQWNLELCLYFDTITNTTKTKATPLLYTLHNICGKPAKNKLYNLVQSSQTAYLMIHLYHLYKRIYENVPQNKIPSF